MVCCGAAVLSACSWCDVYNLYSDYGIAAIAVAQFMEGFHGRLPWKTQTPSIGDLESFVGIKQYTFTIPTFQACWVETGMPEADSMGGCGGQSPLLKPPQSSLGLVAQATTTCFLKLICCRGDIILQVCYMIADVVFPSPPTCPVPSRWTKVFACMDFFVLAASCHFMLVHLIRLGWGKLLDDASISALFTSEELSGLDEQSCDPSVKMGKRKARVQALLDDHMMVRGRGVPLMILFR